MNRKPIVTILLVALMLGNIITLYLVWRKSAVAAPAGQNGPSNPPDRRGAAAQFLIKELGLDSVQQAAYRELMKAHQAEVGTLREQANQKRDAFFEQIKTEGQPDSLLLKKLSQEAAEAQWQMNLQTLAHFRKVRALCRPDQKIKFDQVIQQALRMMGPPPGGGGPPPGHGRPPGAGPGREGPPPPGEKRPPPPPGEKRPPPH